MASTTVDDDGMAQSPPTEFISPMITDIHQHTDISAMTFKMVSAGQAYCFLLANPQYLNSGNMDEPWVPLTEELLRELFADCGICQVFDPESQKARMEFQKTDAHPLVKAARIHWTHGDHDPRDVYRFE